MAESDSSGYSSLDETKEESGVGEIYAAGGGGEGEGGGNAPSRLSRFSVSLRPFFSKAPAASQPPAGEGNGVESPMLSDSDNNVVGDGAGDTIPAPSAASRFSSFFGKKKQANEDEGGNNVDAVSIKVADPEPLPVAADEEEEGDKIDLDKLVPKETFFEKLKDKIYESAPEMGTDMDDLKEKGLAIPLVLLYFAMFFIALIYLTVTGATAEVNKMFLGLDRTDPTIFCIEVPLSVNGAFLGDTLGEWETSNLYAYNESLYGLQFAGSLINTLQYQMSIEGIKQKVKQLGERMAKRDLSWGFLAYAAFGFTDTSTNMYFYSSASAGDIYNLDIAAAAVASFRGVCTTNDTANGGQIKHSPWAKLITGGYNRAEGAFTLSMTVGKDNVKNNGQLDPDYPDGPCPEQGNIKSLWGWDPSTNPDFKVNLEFDINTITTVMAANLGIISTADLTNSRSVYTSEFLGLPMGDFWYDPYYVPMQPIYCLDRSLVDPDGPDVCFYPKGSAKAMNLLYPMTSQIGKVVNANLQPCKCPEDAETTECNQPKILIGLFYNLDSTLLLTEGMVKLGLDMQKKIVAQNKVDGTGDAKPGQIAFYAMSDAAFLFASISHNYGTNIDCPGGPHQTFAPVTACIGKCNYDYETECFPWNDNGTLSYTDPFNKKHPTGMYANAQCVKDYTPAVSQLYPLSVGIERPYEEDLRRNYDPHEAPSSVEERLKATVEAEAKAPSGTPQFAPTAIPSHSLHAISHTQFQPTHAWRERRLQANLDPTSMPTSHPTPTPTSHPTSRPTSHPTSRPTSHPTSSHPTSRPTSHPTPTPTSHPSSRPTSHPTSSHPTSHPSSRPTSSHPTSHPSSRPTSHPSSRPTSHPSSRPSRQPTTQPTLQPTGQPTSKPTSEPSRQPTTQPTLQPTGQPTGQPSKQPTSKPTSEPSRQPTSHPSSIPTSNPTNPTSQPTRQPSSQPTRLPSSQPSRQPISRPTGQPSSQPSSLPTLEPSGQPTSAPSTFYSGIAYSYGGDTNQYSNLPQCFKYCDPKQLQIPSTLIYTCRSSDDCPGTAGPKCRDANGVWTNEIYDLGTANRMKYIAGDFRKICPDDKCAAIVFEINAVTSIFNPLNKYNVMLRQLTDKYYPERKPSKALNKITDGYASNGTKLSERIMCVDTLYDVDALEKFKTPPVQLVQAYFNCHSILSTALQNAVGAAVGAANLYSTIAFSIITFIFFRFMNATAKSKEEVLVPLTRKEKVQQAKEEKEKEAMESLLRTLSTDYLGIRKQLVLGSDNPKSAKEVEKWLAEFDTWLPPRKDNGDKRESRRMSTKGGKNGFWGDPLEDPDFDFSKMIGRFFVLKGIKKQVFNGAKIKVKAYDKDTKFFNVVVIAPPRLAGSKKKVKIDNLKVLTSAEELKAREEEINSFLGFWDSDSESGANSGSGLTEAPPNAFVEGFEAPPEESLEETASLGKRAVGQSIELKNLLKDEYNGAVAVVTGYDELTQFYSVRVLIPKPLENKRVKIKEENIVFLGFNAALTEGVGAGPSEASCVIS